jgi:thiamine-phosphate diphosphorylase
LLCLVAGGPVASGLPLVAAVDRAVKGGVNMVQLRQREMPAADLLVLAMQLKTVCGHRAMLFINDRVDVALAVGAVGVQLGERSLPVDAVRSIAGDRLMIGRSVHSVEGAVAARSADFLVVGTIYPSATHPGAAAAGPELVRGVVRATAATVVGIGGITAANAGDVTAAGAAGVAVVGAVLGAADPFQAAVELRRAITGTDR